MPESAPPGYEPIWVTGAGGFIGQNLVAKLTRCEPKRPIFGVGRGDTNGLLKQNKSLAYFVSDDLSETSLNALFSVSGRPKTVFHLAAGSSVGRSIAKPLYDFQSTAAGTAVLFNWLGVNAPEARVIQTSSAAVYGAGHEGPISETTHLAPLSPYGWHKKISEDLATCEWQKSGLRIATIRVFSVFGEGLRKQLFWDVARKFSARTGKIELMGTGAEVRDWCHVGAVVNSLVEVSQSDRVFADGSSPLNLGSGLGVTVNEAVCQFVRALLPSNKHLPKILFSNTRPQGDPPSLVADTGRLREFGISVPSAPFEDLAKTAAWYRKEFGLGESGIHLAARAQMAGRPNVLLQSRLRVP